MVSYISEVRHVYLFLEEIMCSLCDGQREHLSHFQIIDVIHVLLILSVF